MDDFEPFHSAVNRIPVLRNIATRAAALGNLSPELFGEKQFIPGHDRLCADRWSGSIDLEMTVRTPLVFGEQKDGNVDLPLDDDGHPVVPPTMVKGMISRAYETLTCSRFRVFGDVENRSGRRRTKNDHSELLTYRADPAAANNLLPGRVFEQENGGLAVEILDGFGKNARVALIRDDLNDGHGAIACTNHPDIRPGPGGRINPQQVFTRFRRLTRHGEMIEVQLTQWKDLKGGRHLMVTGVWQDDDRLEKFFDIDSGTDIKTFNVWGYPCRTSPEGRTARELFGDDKKGRAARELFEDDKKGKTYERFFFKSTREGSSLDGTVLPLNPDHVTRYATVLRSYSAQQQAPGGDEHLLNRAAATHPAPSDNALSDGDLVFVQLDRTCASGSDGIPADARVVDVLPTMVGRRPYSRSPRELAAAQKVLPLTKSTEVSAADRLFGYVVPDAEDGATGGDVAYRGRLSFGVVDASEARVSREKKKLSPLLSPKTSSARRFLTDASGATPSKGKNPLPRSDYFAPGQLLGAAAYPVHRGLVQGKGLDGSEFPAQATKAPVLDGREQDNAAVRLTARSWMKTGSILRCTMLFSNLSRDELAALIWVLTPRNLVPPKEKQNNPDAVGYLRMGLGKPLGLGTLEVSIAKNGLRAVRGADLAKSYANLDGCLGLGAPVVGVEGFPLPNEALLLKTPWVRAMQRAAFGYSDGAPVRYMSLKENRANNQTSPRTGDPKEGYGQSPTDLLSESPRPLKIKKPPQKTKKPSRS